jgi:serine/threonine protein kinase
MNRSIDSRSDLYSFGVTLYQMLTGHLPFSASDAMEWVHCHIARKPTPPSERLKNIPASLSAIVMKLLAKTAEERYQTAAGVENDLRRCLAEWEAQGRIGEFPIGEHDTPDRLLVPEKLYGREPEIGTLLASFGRVAASDTPELVLVSGYSGIGKSAVVNELHKALVLPRGHFASGKFDQYKRDIPYATLAQAFRTLIRQILSKSDKEADLWRKAVRDAVEPNGQLIVNLIPELRWLIGERSFSTTCSGWTPPPSSCSSTSSPTPTSVTFSWSAHFGITRSVPLTPSCGHSMPFARRARLCATSSSPPSRLAI